MQAINIIKNDENQKVPVTRKNMSTLINWLEWGKASLQKKQEVMMPSKFVRNYGFRCDSASFGVETVKNILFYMEKEGLEKI